MDKSESTPKIRTPKHCTSVGEAQRKIEERRAIVAAAEGTPERTSTWDVIYATGLGWVPMSIEACQRCDKNITRCFCEVQHATYERQTIENPKAVQAQKEGKNPLEFVPLATLEGAARVLQHGAAKYGRRNWRLDPIKASTYQGAFLRHLTAYYEGETDDPDSGENHLSHVMANCMVMLDAALAGKLIDDRDEMESL